MASTVTTLTLRNGTNSQQSSSSSSELTPVIRIRGSLSSSPSTSSTVTRPINGENERGRHIRWDEKVINNEGMGKKKSKICCIYHAPRAFDESSDESSSCSSDSEGENIYGENIHDSTRNSISCNNSLDDVEDEFTSSNTTSSTIQLPEKRPQNDNINQDEKETLKDDTSSSNHHSLNHDVGKGKNRKNGKHTRANGSPNAYERTPKPRKV